MSKTLCIIPARGGSKRFPGKNLALIGKKSLVRKSIDLAIESQIFDHILLTSDEDKILNEALNHKKIVERHKRSKELADDHTTIKDLVISICKTLNEVYKNVCIILPTAPFTQTTHIREAYKNFQNANEADGIVGLTIYEFPPQFSIYLEDNYIKPAFHDSPLISGNTRSQNQETLFRPNGAFYIYDIEFLLRTKSFWNGKILGYKMDRRNSIDIDTQDDYLYAKYIFESNKKISEKS